MSSVFYTQVPEITHLSETQHLVRLISPSRSYADFPALFTGMRGRVILRTSP